MGLQLIFVVETDQSCQSDWMYIKATLKRFYTLDEAHLKLSPVYMNGRGNYIRREKEAKKLIAEYGSSAKKKNKNNEDESKSIVIYCFDCDKYDKNPEDANFLKDVKEFCDERGYEFVWFCKDIESVYWGEQVPNKQKKDKAASFVAKKQMEKVEEDRLLATNYRLNASNILTILDAIQNKNSRRIRRKTTG